MFTSLRGHGSYKRDLLTALLPGYGKHEFGVRDITDLPGYAPGVFRRLANRRAGRPEPGFDALPVAYHIRRRLGDRPEGWSRPRRDRRNPPPWRCSL